MADFDFTVGGLKRQLAGLDDDTKPTFAGGLTFYRVKRWSDDEVFVEFNEAQADLNLSFRKRNPHIKVAFVSTEAAEWEEDGLIGSIDVSIR